MGPMLHRMIFLYGEKLPAHPFLDAEFAVQWRTSEQSVPSCRMAEQDVLFNGIRRLVKSQCVIAETLTFHRVANPHRVDDFFAFVFCAVIFLGGVSDVDRFASVINVEWLKLSYPTIFLIWNHTPVFIPKS